MDSLCSRLTASEIARWPIADLRDGLLHVYWRIDLKVVANIAQHGVNPLVNEMESVIVFAERAGI